MADRAAMPADGEVQEGPVTAEEGVTAEEEVAAASVEGSAGERITTGPGEGLPTHVPRSVRSLLWQARIGAGLALLFGALALFFFLQASDLRGDAADREAALDAGRGIALQLTNYDGAMIEDWVTETQAMSTDSFAEEVATRIDPVLREAMAANELRSSGEITSSFVQEVEGDSAIVFAVLRQSYASINLPREVSDELRMEIELRREDGRWLAHEVAILGPSTITPITGEDGAAGATEAPQPPAGGEGG